MMKARSLDFITGYVFAKMDRSIFKHFNDNDTKETLVESFIVPKIWFRLSPCQNDIKYDEKCLLRKNICEALNDMYPRLEITCERIFSENQYIRFDFKAKYREVTKKMTVSEIEEMLGYKIEIVDDK